MRSIYWKDEFHLKVVLMWYLLKLSFQEDSKGWSQDTVLGRGDFTESKKMDFGVGNIFQISHTWSLLLWDSVPGGGFGLVVASLSQERGALSLAGWGPLGLSFGLVGVNSHRRKDLRKSSGCQSFPGWLSGNTFIAQRCLSRKPDPSSLWDVLGPGTHQLCPFSAVWPHLLLPLRPGLGRRLRLGPGAEDSRSGASPRPFRYTLGGRVGP